MVVPAKDRLLPAPFVAALRKRIDPQEQAEGTMTGVNGLAERIGVHERRIRAYLSGQPTTKEETGLPRVALVDRWLTALDMSIAEEYGSMYELAFMNQNEARRGKFDRGAWVCVCACGEQMLEVAERCGFCEEEQSLGGRA